MVNEDTQDKVIQEVLQDELPKVAADDSVIEIALQVVFFFAGFVALVFIVIGGYRYVTSFGDPQKTAQAKNTLLYAIIGLIVTLSAFTIIRFVLGQAEIGG